MTDCAQNENPARLAEFELGHALVVGRHNATRRKLGEVVDVMHGDASLSDFAKRIPQLAPPTEIIRRSEQEAQRRQQEAEQHQHERTTERTQMAKVGAQPTTSALMMGRYSTPKGI